MHDLRFSRPQPLSASNPPEKGDTPSPGDRTGPAPQQTPGPLSARSSPPLSPTEQRVYELLLQHLTERQVAEQLERSHNTVHVHVRNIYRKLGVRSRQELFQLPYQPPKATKRNP